MENKKAKMALRVLCVTIAAFVSALNINTFVNAGELFPGGFNGITVFIQRIGSQFFNVNIPFTPVNIALNAFPAYIGLKMVGKKFTMLSCLMILLTGFFVDLLPVLPITEDILLIAVFGGIINGLALSIALRAKASSGGTDFLALALSSKLNVPTWNYVLAMNGILLMGAGYLFGWDKALYSIIFQFCSTIVINNLHTRYKKMTVFIVTEKPDLVGKVLMESTHHGVTRFEGVGCYSNTPKTMLYTVVNTSEIRNLRKTVKELDAKSFINITKTEQLAGRFYQEPLD